jgi:hypothetical protein
MGLDRDEWMRMAMIAIVTIETAIFKDQNSNEARSFHID